MSEWTKDKKQQKYTEIDNEDVFTNEKKQTKFNSITEQAGNYVQDAGRLIKDAGTSAIATCPLLPESVLMLAM